MATTVNAAIQQVLVRLAEDNTSTIAELPAGTGSASSATIATNTQIATFLDEGQKLFCRTPLGQITSTASIAVTAGNVSKPYASFTPAVSGQIPWRLLNAKFTLTSGGTSNYPKIADPQYRSVYYPDYNQTGTPQYVFDAADNCTFAPVPSAAGTLYVTALMLPRTAAVDGDLSDIPDHYVQYIVGFACWRVCEQNAAEPAFAAMLPLYRAEVVAWAGDLIGVGGNK